MTESTNIMKIEDSLPINLEANSEHLQQYLTVNVGDQLFGISVLKVRDVLKPMKITSIPLSPPEIIGYMNLRGRIVTVIDLRTRLGASAPEKESKKMFVVVEHDDELYSLMVDKVGQAKTMHSKDFEKNPVNLSENWKHASKGVFKMDDELMLVLDVNHVIDL